MCIRDSFYRATKVIQARQREAADFVVAALTEIHLVHIQLKNTVFAVTRVHDPVSYTHLLPVHISRRLHTAYL